MVNELPEQIVPLFTVMVGVALTVTTLTAVSAPMQPKALVPVTLYEVVVVGDTTEVPLEKVYVEAPLGVIVKELPLQIVPLFTVIVGVALTVTKLTAVSAPMQPKALVPVTLYEVVVVGDTTEVPLEKVYVEAPEGVMVNELPEQIVPLFTVMVGVVFTVTALTAVFVATQPKALVPVTLYEVVVVGDTTEVPLEKVYVEAPEGVIVKELPLQIVPLFTVMVGVALTVTKLTAVLAP